MDERPLQRRESIWEEAVLSWPWKALQRWQRFIVKRPLGNRSKLRRWKALLRW
jgi:hypothetical protein